MFKSVENRNLAAVVAAVVAIVAVVAVALVSLGRSGGDVSPTELTTVTKATPEQDAAAAKASRAASIAEARHRRRLASPTAKRERVRSRTAYRDLSSDRAKQALKSTHAKVVSTPRWSPPKLRKGESPVAFLSTTTQRVDIPGQKADAIADSPDAPIATERDGKLVGFDISLRASASGWNPVIADLATTFPPTP